MTTTVTEDEAARWIGIPDHLALRSYRYVRADVNAPETLLDELRSVAMLAYARACLSYDPRRHPVAFSTYAHGRVRPEVLGRVRRWREQEAGQFACLRDTPAPEEHPGRRLEILEEVDRVRRAVSPAAWAILWGVACGLSVTAAARAAGVRGNSTAQRAYERALDQAREGYRGR